MRVFPVIAAIIITVSCSGPLSAQVARISQDILPQPVRGLPRGTKPISLVNPQTPTAVRDARAARMLLGRHKLSLQWISWDYFGSATVTNRSGVYHLKGEQKGRKGTDFVRVDGVITEIDAKQFTFDGSIITQVSHINGGRACERKGELNFRITGTRKYWRMQQIDNPCDAVADYVDIYFR